MKLSATGRSILLFIPVLVTFVTANAQIGFGVKGGLSESEMLTSTDQYVYVNGVKQNLKNYPRPEFHAGVLLSIPLSKRFSFQPEAMFSAQGANGKPIVDYVVSATENYHFNYINVPLLLKYNWRTGLFLETGPQIGYLVAVDIDENVVGSYYTTHYHPRSEYKSTDIGWVLGAGYLSPINLGFDIRYNYGLTDINNVTADEMQNAPVQNGSIKNSVIQIGVFYLFGKPRVVVKKDE